MREAANEVVLHDTGTDDADIAGLSRALRVGRDYSPGYSRFRSGLELGRCVHMTLAAFLFLLAVVIVMTLFMEKFKNPRP